MIEEAKNKGGRRKARLPRRLISVRVPDEDYAYLQQLLELGGSNVSQATSELLIGIVQMYKAIFGEDIEAISTQSEEHMARRTMRYALFQMSEALGTEVMSLSGPRKVKGKK